jgi:hypothetical protein
LALNARFKQDTGLTPAGRCITSVFIMRPVFIHVLPTVSALAPAADVRLAPRHEVLLDI